MLPAPGQGAIGWEVGADDARTRRLLDAIHCRETGFRITAERALLAQLAGSCKTPIAALAELEGGPHFRMRGHIELPDRSAVHHGAPVGRAREGGATGGRHIGRATGGERGWQYGEISV